MKMESSRKNSNTDRKKIKEKNLIGITEQKQKKNCFNLFLPCRVNYTSSAQIPQSPRIMAENLFSSAAIYCCCAVANWPGVSLDLANDSFHEKWNNGDTDEVRRRKATRRGKKMEISETISRMKDEMLTKAL